MKYIIRILTIVTLAGLPSMGGAYAETDADFAAKARAWLLSNPEVLLEAMQVLEAREAEAAALIDAERLSIEQEALFNNPIDGHLGQGEAVLVEFFDYQCGFCKRQIAAVEDLAKAYSDKKIILKEFPILGAGSELAARAALATRILAGNAAYLKTHRALMAHQGGFDMPVIEQILASAGLDAQAIIDRMPAPDITAHIEATMALAARIGISGTPAFVFRDGIARGLLSFEALNTRLTPQPPSEEQ